MMLRIRTYEFQNRKNSKMYHIELTIRYHNRGYASKLYLGLKTITSFFTSPPAQYCFEFEPKNSKKENFNFQHFRVFRFQNEISALEKLSKITEITAMDTLL